MKRGRRDEVAHTELSATLQKRAGNADISYALLPEQLRSCTEAGAGLFLRSAAALLAPWARRLGTQMRRLFPLLLLLLATPLHAQSTVPETDKRRILSLENAWDQAAHQKDIPALKMLLGPDLVYVDFDGKLMDKAEYLASVQSQTLQPERIVSESVNVHLYGAVAVVNGLYRENGSKNGKLYMLRERFTDTWVRQNDSWICVASHSTLTTQ
jgi:ketosteroid isomerase-like protein